MHIKRYNEIITENNQYQTVYDDVVSRINKAKLKKYMSENNWDDDDIESAIDYFLDDEYHITICGDGLIDFYILNSDIKKLIGQNMVKLYHFTSDKLVDDIKNEGLVQGKVKTNPHGNSYSGIYLTTNISGKEVTGYKYHIRNKHNSDVVLVTVKMYLSELRPDHDDADLKNGSTQFISDNINPDRIVKIENVI